MKKNTTAEIAAMNWSFNTEDTQFSYDQIKTAAVLEQVKELKNVHCTLKSILSRLDNLGADGLHTILRDLSAQVNKRKKKALADARRRRERSRTTDAS